MPPPLLQSHSLSSRGFWSASTGRWDPFPLRPRLQSSPSPRFFSRGSPRLVSPPSPSLVPALCSQQRMTDQNFCDLAGQESPLAHPPGELEGLACCSGPQLFHRSRQIPGALSSTMLQMQTPYTILPSDAPMSGARDVLVWHVRWFGDVLTGDSLRQVLFVNIVAIWWNFILSLMQHK